MAIEREQALAFWRRGFAAIQTEEAESARALVCRRDGGYQRPSLPCAGVRYGQGFWACHAVHLADDAIGLISEATSLAEQMFWVCRKTDQGWEGVDSAMWRDEEKGYARCLHILPSCTLDLRVS